QTNSAFAGGGPYRLSSSQQKFAAEMVCDFLERSGRCMFPKLDRDDVGIGLLIRIANPNVMNQGQSSLCGPTNLICSLATDQPAQYARYAIDLYEKGKAKIGRLLIEPGTGVRDYLPPRGAIPQVDWLTTASLRDSENWFFHYDSVDREFAGITLPGE